MNSTVKTTYQFPIDFTAPHFQKYKESSSSRTDKFNTGEIPVKDTEEVEEDARLVGSSDNREETQIIFLHKRTGLYRMNCVTARNPKGKKYLEINRYVLKNSISQDAIRKSKIASPMQLLKRETGIDLIPYFSVGPDSDSAWKVVDVRVRDWKKDLVTSRQFNNIFLIKHLLEVAPKFAHLFGDKKLKGIQISPESPQGYVLLDSIKEMFDRKLRWV